MGSRPIHRCVALGVGNCLRMYQLKRFYVNLEEFSLLSRADRDGLLAGTHDVANTSLIYRASIFSLSNHDKI